MEELIENIPEVTPRGPLAAWIRADTLDSRAHTAAVEEWMGELDEQDLTSRLAAAAANARDYHGFVGGQRSAQLLEEWDRRSKAWSVMVAAELGTAALQRLRP